VSARPSAWPSLRERLGRPGLVLTAEIDPPRAPDLGSLLGRAERFAPWVDAVNVTDGSLARVRMAGLAAAAAIRERVGLEVIAHLTTRDRNRIAVQADLLGAAAWGLRSVLVLSGDPPGRGDEPEARPAGDIDAEGLLRLVGALNRGTTGSGQPLDGSTDLFPGCAANPGADDLDAELEKLARRIEKGARFVQTQPCFDPERALRFERRSRELGVPVLYGLLPLRDAERARHFSAIPGMAVPPAVLARLESEGPAAGAAILLEMARALAPEVSGLHLFPMGSARTVQAVAEAVAPWRGSGAPHA
jgi:methylenetetrahydrofolate reductase (NADPH)